MVKKEHMHTQDDVDEQSFQAAASASFLAALSMAFVIVLSTYMGRKGLVFGIKSLFPENIYFLGMVLIFGFALISLALCILMKSKNLSFIKEFFAHFSILSGAFILIFGLLSRAI